MCVKVFRCVCVEGGGGLERGCMKELRQVHGSVEREQQHPRGDPSTGGEGSYCPIDPSLGGARRSLVPLIS